jgi:hypothetical protein
MRGSAKHTDTTTQAAARRQQRTVPHVVSSCACSGYCYKFARAIGESLTDLSTSGHSVFGVESLSPNCFAV